MSDRGEQPAAAETSDRADHARAMPQVDVRALAEKVYRLMLAEARLELARGGRLPPRED